MVYCIYCGLNRLELQAKHQLHGRAPVPAARPSLFTLFNYLEFSWAIRRAHDVQTLLRTPSTVRSPPRTSPKDRVEGPACSSEHRASGKRTWQWPCDKDGDLLPLYCSSPLLILLGLARIRGWHRLDFCLFFDSHRGSQQKERSRKVMCLHWGHGREL
jgi:hypothetical protein